METGGVLSHGPILVREFGLPAVAGIAQALSTIRTGQRVRIDGNLGEIYLLDR
jgi:phosphoenolpyruvate-protein kinase (PTS system EI component)